MTDFFTAYKSHLIYVIIVIISWILLRKLTNVLHKWLLKKKQQRFPGESPKSVNRIRQILNTLWLVLGLIALSFLFVNRDRYGALEADFKLVFYLGFLAIGTIIAAGTVNIWFKNEILKRIAEGNDPTSFKFLRSVAFFSIYSLGILFGLMAFPSMKGIANTALGGAGVLALIIGVASQEALANLVGGVFIITFKPFKVGDVIKVTDTMVGTVSDITLRHTIIRNFENKMIVIPNSIINKEKLINYDLGELKCCEHIEIGISYDSDVELAKKILQEECESHPLIYDNRNDLDKADGKPIVKVSLINLGESSVTIRAWAWGENFGNCFSLKCDVLTSVKAKFESAGIEIPYPYRTVILKKEQDDKSKESEIPND